MMSGDLSPAVREKLSTYLEMLKKWNARINLVAPGTIQHAETRHFQDSIQIFDLAPKNASNWVDLGTGGGFPGLVVAIVASELHPTMHVTLVESDQRKCAFLRSVSRETKIGVTVHSQRIEELEPQNADIVSARALADLDLLLGYCERHIAATGRALLPKGENWRKEIEKARLAWSFDYNHHKSQTNPSSVILDIGEIARV